MSGSTHEVRARDAERLLADVQRLADIGYWEWDVLEDRVTWSPELYRLFGIDPEVFDDATYDAYLALIHPDDRATMNDVVQRAYATGEEYSVEHRVIHPDGSTRWIIGRGTVELDETDRPVRLFGVAVDVTDRKRSEQVLREFISNAAHELRTPVAAMSTAVSLLTETDASAEEREDVLAILQRQMRRMEQLSNDLLDLTTLEGRSAPVLLTSLSVEPIIEGALAQVGLRDVELDIEPGVAVMAGPTELETVLRHLLTNARHHGGPHVVVRAQRHGDHVEIVVEDDGLGVPEAARASLFSPFTRGSGAQRPGTGTGLGLAIVRKLLTMQRGSIEYRDRPGGGARFTVRLGAVG